MATAQVYRSVKLVLQNSTNENLTVQGFAVLSGAWGDKQAPTQGMLVGEQSAVEWTSVSTTLGSGTAAYVRFGTSHGYPLLRWALPWTGPFEVIREDVTGLRIDIVVDDRHPDAVIILATVLESPRG